jgi:hypothetical protein
MYCQIDYNLENIIINHNYSQYHCHYYYYTIVVYLYMCRLPFLEKSVKINLFLLFEKYLLHQFATMITTKATHIDYT